VERRQPLRRRPSLPIDVVRRVGDRREPQAGHSVEDLLNVQPNDEMTAFTFRNNQMSHSDETRSQMQKAEQLHQQRNDI